MKNKEFSSLPRALIIILFFAIWIFIESIPRIIVENTGKEYVSFMGVVYYRLWNVNSPTNHYRVVPVRGAKTNFTLIGRDCIKDAYHVFCNGRILPGADPNTFVAYNNMYTRDKNKFFRWDIEISEVEFNEGVKLLQKDN